MKIRTIASAAVCALTVLSSGSLAVAQDGTEAAQTPADVAASEERILHLVEISATMEGVVAPCDPQEAEYVRTCTGLIINNWSRLSGLPDVKGKGFRKKVAVTWADAMQAAGKYQEKNKAMSCPAAIKAEQESVIWKVCGRPNQVEGETPDGSLPPSDGINMQ